MIPAGYPRDLPSALLRAARDFGTAGVVEIGPDGRETRLDFPTLLELAARILAGLRANGVRAGDPAVVHCTEPVGFFAAFWACTLGGIRPLLISPSPAGDRSEEGRERLRKVTELLGWTVLIGRPSDLPDDLGLPVLDPDALAGHEPTSDFHRPAADDVAVLMMSSGSSTGTPKITQLTHRGLVEFAAGTPAMLPVRPGQVTLNWLPLDQSGAFLLYHLLPVFTGCTNIHVNTGWVLSDPLRWLDLMDQHRVNHSWSPNFGYRLVTTAIAGEPDRHWDLSALRSLVSGGEQITVPVMSEFLRLTNRFGVVPETFVAAWGMTETVTGITFARPGLTPNVHRVRIAPTGVVEWVDQATPTGKVAVARPGKPRADDPGVLSLVSVGAPAPGTTVRIVGPNGAVLPEGRIGQLQVASARVTPGYLGNPEADRAAFPVGNWPARKWLATGDQAFIVGGQVVITGRDSERIVLNGENHYAHEIEAVAGSVPGAPEGLIAACGVADNSTGTDRLVVFYAAVPELRPDLDAAINRALSDRLGLVAQVVAVPRHQFPTTPGGKILRPLLKQRWIENSFDQSRPLRPAASAADALDTATAPPTFEEDPAERTMELPVVRLAWRREIKDSIPKPPERPTFGANRETSYEESDDPQLAPAEPTPVVELPQSSYEELEGDPAEAPSEVKTELPGESSYEELTGDPESAPDEPTAGGQAAELDAPPEVPAAELDAQEVRTDEFPSAADLSSAPVGPDDVSPEAPSPNELPADPLGADVLSPDASAPDELSGELHTDAPSETDLADGLLPASSSSDALSSAPPRGDALSSEAAPADVLSSEAAPADVLSSEAAPADPLSSGSTAAVGRPSEELEADALSPEAAPAGALSSEAASSDVLSSEAVPADALSSGSTAAGARPSKELEADALSPEKASARVPQSGVDKRAAETPNDHLSEAARIDALSPETAPTDVPSPEAAPSDALSPAAALTDALVPNASPADGRPSAQSVADEASDAATPADAQAADAMPDDALTRDASTSDLSPEASTDGGSPEAAPADALAAGATAVDASSAAWPRTEEASNEATQAENLPTEVAPPGESASHLPSKESADDRSPEASTDDVSSEAAPANAVENDAPPADATSAAGPRTDEVSDEPTQAENLQTEGAPPGESADDLPSGESAHHHPSEASTDDRSPEAALADALGADGTSADASSAAVPRTDEASNEATQAENLQTKVALPEESANHLPSEESAGLSPEESADHPSSEESTDLSLEASTDALSSEAAPADAAEVAATPADATSTAESRSKVHRDEATLAEDLATEVADEAVPPRASTDDVSPEAAPADALDPEAAPANAHTSAESRSDVHRDEAPPAEDLATEVADEAVPPRASTSDVSPEAAPAGAFEPDAAPVDASEPEAAPTDARPFAGPGADGASDEAAPAENLAPEVAAARDLSPEASTDDGPSPEATPTDALQSATSRTTETPAEAVRAGESTAEQLATGGEPTSDGVPSADDAPRTADAQTAGTAPSTNATPADQTRVAETAPSTDGSPVDVVEVAKTAPAADSAPADEVQVAETAPSTDGSPVDDVEVAETAPAADSAPADEVQVDSTSSPANSLPEEPPTSADAASVESSTTDHRSDAVAPLADDDAVTGDEQEAGDEQPTQILSARDVLSSNSSAGQPSESSVGQSTDSGVGTGDLQHADDEQPTQVLSSRDVLSSAGQSGDTDAVSGDAQDADDEQPTQILSTREVLSSTTSQAEVVKTTNTGALTDDELRQAESLPAEPSSQADGGPADVSSAESPATDDALLTADAPSGDDVTQPEAPEAKEPLATTDASETASPADVDAEPARAEASNDPDALAVESSVDTDELADESSTHADDLSTELASLEATAPAHEAPSADTPQLGGAQEPELQSTDGAPNADDAPLTADDAQPVAAEASATDDVEPAVADVGPSADGDRPVGGEASTTDGVEPAVAGVDSSAGGDQLVAGDASAADGVESAVADVEPVADAAGSNAAAQQAAAVEPAGADVVAPVVGGNGPDAEVAQQAVEEGPADGDLVPPVVDGGGAPAEVAQQAGDEAPAGGDLVAPTTDDVPAADTSQAEDAGSAELQAGEASSAGEGLPGEVATSGGDERVAVDGTRSVADEVTADESAEDRESADQVDADDTGDAAVAPLEAAPTLAAALPTGRVQQPDEVAAGSEGAAAPDGAFVAVASGEPDETAARRDGEEEPARQTDVSVTELAPAPAAKGTRSPAHAGRGTASGQVAEPVAVIGLAARLPGATGLDQFWDNLVNGVESLRRFSPEELRSVGDAEAFGDDELVAVSGALDDVESFDAAFFGLSAREAELTDPAQRLFLEVCQQALEHGGHAGSSSRIGVFAGSGMNLYSQGAQPGENLATRVAYRLGLTGPAIGVQAAWSSSLVAVHLACQALRSGDADLALAGAAAVHVPQATGYHASPGSILSPTGHIRAFDADADGTVGGNGVAAVLLKRLDQAIADGDTVYAVIRGSAVSEGDQVELVERALEKSGVPADSISYVEASASGTADADAAEFRALSNALRKHTDKVGFCTIGSVKPNIGHLASAAGMAGLIKTILMLQHRTLVPTINYARPNPELPLANGPFVIGTEVRDWESGTPLRAGVSALDARGTSAHVILEEAPRQIRRGDDGPVVLALSAPDPHGLSDLAELFRADLEIGTGHRLIDLAGTAALGRPAHRHRIAVAGSSEQELAEALGSAIPAEVPRGGPGPLGYAFTGQGAARRGMAAGLAARFPVFRSVLDECDKVYAEEFGGSLLDLLLTSASGSEGVWPTETAQPALFAFELALARLWESFGVRPALVVGHSVGEYAALCVAGALSTADGVRLTAKRGQLMQRGTVPGAMVAVRADADRVRELAKTPGVEVAAGNGPQSFVLAGSEVIVGQLAEQLDRLDVSWQRLDVDRAFHSSLVEPILSDFAEFVATIKLRPLRTPMVSSWSGDLLESGTKLDEDYLVGQLRQPVQFGDAVEALTAAGCRRFLELGPDAVLSPAGRRIAPNSTWIPAQRLGQDPVLATMNGLAELYLQGTEINWAKVYADGGRVPLPTYPFRRVHYPVDVFARSAEQAAKAVRPESAAEPVDDLRPIERTSGALKRIPLDPPSRPKAAEQTEPDPEPTEESSPFAIPADDVDRVVVRDTAAVVDERAEVEPTSANVAASNKIPENEPEAPDRADESGYAAAADPEVVAERYRESLDLVLDLTSEQLGLDPYDVTVDHSFTELGADPALMQRVVDAVQRKFDVEIKAEALFEDLITPHKLASAVAAKTPPSAFTSRRKQTTLKPPRIKVLPEYPKKEQPSSRTALAVLGSGLADLAAKVDAAAAATSEAELPGSGMAALMSQQLRVASQLVEGVTKLMHEQLALLGDVPAPTTQQRGQDEDGPDQDGPDQGGPNPGGPNRGGPARSGPGQNEAPVADDQAGAGPTQAAGAPGATPADPPQAPSNQTESTSAASALDEATGTTTAQDPEQAEAERARQRAAVDYWQAALSGAQPLVLPADRARPEAAAGTAVLVHEVDAGLGEAVSAFSRQRRVSPLMTMLAAVGTVLGRFAAQDDITIGAAALRSQEPMPLPLRIDLSGEPDLGELAQRVREATTGAFDHAGADLAVLEQDPLYQVLVVFEPTTDELPAGLDLRLTLANHTQGITCTADYRAGLFDESTIKRVLDYLEAVLRRAVAQPATTLPDLMLPIESDRQTLRELEGAAPETGPIGRVGRNAVVSGELSGLHTLFEQQVARTPDAIALIQGDREISYAELDRRANAVAWQLVDLGVKPGQLVAVRVARGAELVVGVLAVLKSGAAYLPLDPGVPESRWAFMTADSGAVALVGDDAALADRLGLRLVPVASGDGDVRAQQAPPVKAAADDVAYCIYTSGSTGNPKGVAVPHRGPVNLIRHYLRTRSSLRTLQWTSFGFDVHVQEMFTALASGAALVLIGEDDRYDPDAVVAALTEHGIERLFMTFTPLTALLATMEEMPKLPALREIVAGGEAMVLTHGIRDFLAAHPDCVLFNEYGPTEASIVTTIHQVDPADDRPSIGRPIDGVVVRLLDEALRPVPVGAVGEIHLGGVAVAQGYVGRPDETMTAFVADPSTPGSRLYRTRDLGRWRPDGTLDYLGRVDDQVKIRGHRVEPGETEHVLADLDGVIDAVVVACVNPAGDTCLIGYVVLEDEDPAVLARLMLELTKELPIYLVPADLIPIEDLPLDAAGKLDRRRLPEPEWLQA